MSVHKVGGLEHLMQIHKRSNNNQTAQNIPKPEVSGAEAISDTTSAQFVTNTVGDSMISYNTRNAQSDGGYNKQ